MHATLALAAPLLALALAACAHPGAPARAPAVAAVTAQTLARQMAAADVVGDAVLLSWASEAGTDGMNVTLQWRIVRCHAGDCRPGQAVHTRSTAPPFATSGAFCNVRDCVTRAHLRDHVGSTFLVTFARMPYEHQTASNGGVPHDGAMSLNRGYYLVQRGDLYQNDPHWLLDAGYEQTLRTMARSRGDVP